MTRQTLLSDQDIFIEHEQWSDNAVEDYAAMKEDIEDLKPLIGEGSPEGLVRSNNSLKYIDTSVPQEYFNPVSGNKNGWVAL